MNKQILFLIVFISNIICGYAQQGTINFYDTATDGNNSIGPYDSNKSVRINGEKDVHIIINEQLQYTDAALNVSNNSPGGTSLLKVHTGGQVSIGKNSAASKLDVEGSIRSSDGNDNVTLQSVNADNLSEIIWGDDLNDRFRFYYNYWNGTSGDKEVMSLLPSGNVGIGTTTPDAKLAVKGNIHAEEVKVDLSVPGPDYVFKEGYDLKSLEEVQNYIKKEGHLPNIASAEDMEANGIELGEMNMRLLEKIEELTLYVIKLNQNQSLLMEQNQQMKQELEKLKNEK